MLIGPHQILQIITGSACSVRKVYAAEVHAFSQPLVLTGTPDEIVVSTPMRFAPSRPESLSREILRSVSILFERWAAAASYLVILEMRRTVVGAGWISRYQPEIDGNFRCRKRRAQQPNPPRQALSITASWGSQSTSVQSVLRP